MTLKQETVVRERIWVRAALTMVGLFVTQGGLVAAVAAALNA